MYHWPTGMGHQVSVVFSTNITLLEFLRANLVQNKSFLSIFYQLAVSTPKKNCHGHDKSCPVHDAIYGEVLIEPKKYFVNIKRTVK